MERDEGLRRRRDAGGEAVLRGIREEGRERFLQFLGGWRITSLLLAWVDAATVRIVNGKCIAWYL